MRNGPVKVVEGIVKNTGTPLDGMRIQAGLWEWDDCNDWHLRGWSDEVDDAVMRTMHAEDPLYSSMPIDEFKKLWKDKEYEPDGVYCIGLGNLEVTKVLSGEGT